jgi:hypothetical protein
MHAQVCVGVVLPCSYVYSCQLRSRRQWRRNELTREEHRRWVNGKCPAAKVDPSMKLVPVWKMYLPHIATVLLAATVAGHDLQQLTVMFSKPFSNRVCNSALMQLK